jgi:tetratricopeptide (TPR) repeat protein
MAFVHASCIVVALLAAACGARPKLGASWPDAEVELRDETDRDAAIDRLWIMPPGKDRDRARTEIAAATAARIRDALEEDRPIAAAILLDQLTWMWSTEPTALGRGLAPHVELLVKLRAQFAKAGALEPAVQTVIVLSEADPARRTEHLAELDEILAFADELAISEHGPDGARAQQIALLQPTALALPLPWVVDRYVSLLVERQRVVATLLDQKGASMALVRAHSDILATAARIANVLARAGRSAEIHRHLSRIQGIGTDRELGVRAEIVADQPTADAFDELATQMRADEHAADPAAALAICIAGLERFPKDATLLASAGGDARALGRVDQAIAFYEAALAGSPASAEGASPRMKLERDAVEVDTAVALRLGKLYADRIGRLAGGGRPRAASSAWNDVKRFTSRAARTHPHSVWQQTAAIAESALGKGLASQGLINDARYALAASLERAPSIDALETLTTIESQLDRFSQAQRWASAGIGLLGEATTGDRYRRAKLQRLAADALRRAGKLKEAAPRYLDSLRSWASLGEDKDLPRSIVAERRLDLGRVLWWLGDPAKAVDEVLKAVDADPDSPEIGAGAVAFLITAGRYRDALDAYHRGLGEPEGSELFKVYTSLWIVGEAKRLGLPQDRLAVEYLAARRGDLWYELLARAASGKLSLEILRAAATTGPRQSELAFYSAVLGLDPAANRRALLQQAVSARIVMDAEYDLARFYLSQP